LNKVELRFGIVETYQARLGTLRCTAKIWRPQSQLIRSNPITRSPTACALPPQATPGASDRIALQRYAAPLSQSRRQQLRARDRSFWAANVLAGPVTSALERSPPDALAMSDDLPPPNTQRWVVRRKAAVITAVRSGRISREVSLRRYNLTEEEYRSWERAFDEHGLAGLRSTRLQQYRGPWPPRSRR
jgi:Protein of unknown function (DUF1153)